MPISMLLFLTAVALADSRRFEQIPDDVVAALQVAQQTTGNSAQHRISCGDFLLEDKQRTPIKLRPRQSPAKVFDTFAFGSAYETEEFLLRMYEMGEEVSKFYIVEGDRDFNGKEKPYELEAILNSGQLDAWKDKIKYHKVKIPMGVSGYNLQRVQRRSLRSQMRDYDQRDILLDGDLDEIVSHKTLKILKNCEPVSGSWNAYIRMPNFMYSLAWRHPEDWGGPTVAGFFSEGLAPIIQGIQVPSDNILGRPNRLSARDGSSPGWHFSWILNGTAGLAHKFCIRIEGIPSWANCSDKTAFATYLETEVLAKLKSNLFDPLDRVSLIPSKIAQEDVPQALILHPEKFPNILRDVQW